MSLTLAQFKLMADRSTEEVYLFGRDGRFRYVNDTAAHSLGYTRRELMELRLSDVDPTYTPEYRPPNLERLEAHPELVFEVTHRSRDGQPLRKEVRTTYLQVDGEALICCFARIPSQRLHRELELRQVTRLFGLLSRVNHSIVHQKQQQALMAAVCEAAVDFGFRMAWVGLLDAQGVVKPACSAGHVAGYLDDVHIDINRPETSSGPTGIAVREGRLDVCGDILTEARMKPWLEQAVLRGYLSSAAVPLRRRGQVIGALNLYAGEPGFFSERECQLLRQIGEDLSFAFDVLASHEERERLGVMLEQSRKLESVGRLAGGVAHDFNNFLTVILSGVQEVLEELPESSPLREPLEETRDAAQRSVELARQLLTFARRTPHSPRVLDLNELVEGAMKLLRRFVGEGPALVWTPCQSPWPVKVDPSQVNQVLSNLCLNARDALPGGKGTIRLSTQNVTLDGEAAVRRGLPPGAYLALSVSDDGTGMSPEVQAHLFEPLFTTKPVGRGTGLGLASVYGIVRQAGGAITCESAVGRGSTFTITWPRAVEGVALESKAS